ncbi:Chitin synthase 2 [Varanus komodoensis]|nr:Chitin synthase 2 [Varanus komodoensis]
MLHFCLAHAAYHLSRWLPKQHRFRLQLLIFAFGISAVLLQFYILLRPKSSHYCSQPLLYNLVGSIVFTFFALGLALLLVTIEPVPWELQIVFAAFGVASFAEGACTTALTASARQCVGRLPPGLHFAAPCIMARAGVGWFSIMCEYNLCGFRAGLFMA